MSPQKEEAPLWQSLGTIGAFAILFIVGPVTGLVLGSWWPILGGFMIMISYFMVIITINLVREHRRPPTLGEALVGSMMNRPVSTKILREMLAKAEEREAKEREKLQ